MKRSILALVVLAVMSTVTAAQQFQLPHDPSNPAHWYPEGCCSLMDCEAIPIEGVIETATGWHIDYVSKRMGRVVVDVPRSSDRAKPNEHDGQYHGCFYRGRGMGPTGDAIANTDYQFRCFWYPLWS
jgi:hypothetical protein